MKSAGRLGALLCSCFALNACGGDDSNHGGADGGDSTGNTRPLVDPGTDPWQPVPMEQIADVCRLDPSLLAEANATLQTLGGSGYAVVRYGKLCYEYSVAGADTATEAFSATKTLGGLVTGIAAYETRDFTRTDRKTGPISDLDRVDHWLDDFTFNADALIAHVLGMEAHNTDLSVGMRTYAYDALGDVQINRLSDIVNTAIAQDAARLGANIEEFTQRFLYQPLGMTDTTWTGGAATKVYAYTWVTTLRDMARVGLLMLNGGMWNGRRVLDAEWVYKMTHPSFEDANTAYGYLTWLASRSNWVNIGGPKLEEATDTCLPAALWNEYPHEPSGAPDCQYLAPNTCEQEFDEGVWFAAGLDGQYIFGHPGLDMVIVVKNLNVGVIDPRANTREFWASLRRSIVALDPEYAGDDAAFCAAYGQSRYAPDLRR